MNNKLGRVWKEAVMAKSECQSSISLKETTITKKENNISRIVNVSAKIQTDHPPNTNRFGKLKLVPSYNKVLVLLCSVSLKGVRGHSFCISHSTCSFFAGYLIILSGARL
jgi:hypothetical protein